MDKDFDNTLSLNPFDRPPNITDEDLNSVTQEELEANLSTDCPISNIESNVATSLEQLMQSVLEDTSTQDAIEDNVLRNSCDGELELIDEILKKENKTEDNNKLELASNIIGENSEENTDTLEMDGEKIIMDIKLSNELISTQEAGECFYVDTINKEDDNGYHDVCQVEVYASSKEASELKSSIAIKDEPIDHEHEEDNISNASSVTIGHLESPEKEDEFGDKINEDNDKESHLSVITSDHCYSQEVMTAKERDVLKEYLINYMAQKTDQNEGQQNLSCLADKILYGLDNNILGRAIDSFKNNVRDNVSKEHDINAKIKEESGENSDEFQAEVGSKSEPTNREPSIICDFLELNTELKQNSKAFEDIKKYNSLEDIQVAEGHINKASKKSPETSKKEENDNVHDTVSIFSSQECGTMDNQSIRAENTPIPQENGMICDEVFNLNESNENQSSTTTSESNKHDEIVCEENNNEVQTSQRISMENEVNVSPQLSNTESSLSMTQIKDNLPDNCSEPLENRMFDEEFELLCKNGSIPINKGKRDGSLPLLEKLNDFATIIQKDCKAFLSASTNIEQKLHEYMKQQYERFQELFKSYGIQTERFAQKPQQQSIETQTDLKPLTKRYRRAINMESKTKLLKASGTSTSSEDESEGSLRDSKQKSPPIHRRFEKAKSNELPVDMGDKKIRVKQELNDGDPTDPLTYLSIGNCSQEYDDGINLSQYVQSEIFDLDSLSQQTPLSSSSATEVEDSDTSLGANVQNHGDEVQLLEEDDDNSIHNGDSDSTILFNVNRKKSKKTSSSPSLKRKMRNCDSDEGIRRHNSESDKENLSGDHRKEIKNDCLNESEKNDKEIERLINIGGLAKRSNSSAPSNKSSEKSKPKSVNTKSLNDNFDFMDVEFGSDDEVKSEAEEETITEKQFLERRNEEIKRQLLNESSTDSEVSEDENDELLKMSSEEDESGKNPPLVEKFLKTFVVDDSDNDLVDEDIDDIEMDSDKEDESINIHASVANNEATSLTKEDDDRKEGDENETKKVENETKERHDGESPTASDIELLNDNLLYRKRSSRPQKLDKMLSDAEKRKKISKIDEQLISLSSESDNSDVEAIDDENSQSSKPRAIKPMLRPDQLAGETIKAQKSENERLARLEKKHNMLEKVLKDYPDLDKNKDLILDYIKETKTFIKVHPAIVKQLKPHQFDGVRFMYDSCYGGVDALKKSPGSGCILAHCMGLGKTLQLISLLHTVISYKELKTTKILVLCPKSTVMNWADEIIRWLGPLRQKNLKVYTFSDTSDISEKLSILREWSLSNQTRAGCLLIGYEAFRTLVCYHSYKNRGNVSAQRLEQIRKSVNSYLLQPGADLVICDEGHIIKNSKSAISQAVAQIVTPRRIVLTGTPIQNNLKEYYSMVNFIKPLFLGTEKEFANLYANPIKNGQHKDSGKTDIKIMKQRSFVLHKKLSKFVQRKEAELLKTFLPQKFEYVLFIPMTDVQNNLYQYILTITNRGENNKGKGLITDYTCLRKIWTHPKVLEDAWKNAIKQRNKKEIRKTQMGHNSEDDQPDDIYDSHTGQMSVTNDWWRSLVTEKDLESVMPSNKLRAMFKILQMCEEKGEKCLIFSAFVAVLNVVEYFFQKITENDQTVKQELGIMSPSSQWVLGKDYYRLDGKTPKSIRHCMISEFNNVHNKGARVFLISAKAGGQGINLIGANRVIILDTSWNPSNDQQNIFRVFRLGQKRNCYIYRLLAMGTMEEKVYSRSVTKQAMSFRVVDEQQIDRHYSMAELTELYTLTLPDYTNRPTPILPQDSILARLLRSFPEIVYKYHEHDSLLENKVEQELSEQEKTEAWTAYERDLQMSSEQREMPNIEDLHNKFNASNLGNYLSPFSGLDVSNNNTGNTNNSNNNKNMSHFFGARGAFGQPLLQSLLGPNNNPPSTQQYLDVLNYYKNLGTYADLNSYSALMNAGRLPVPSPSTSAAAANPLAALGDLSMYGLTSPALPAASTMNLANSVLAGSLPQLQTPSSSAAMYTSVAPSMMASTASNAGLTNTTNSAALSAFEQYTQNLRGTFPNMYSYASDFGLGSSGSTILDKSKSNKKQSSSSSSGGKNSTNLPGGSSKSNNNSMSLYPGSSTYITPHPQQQHLPQHQQQQQQQLQHQSHQSLQSQSQSHQSQSRPNSRNTPVDITKKSKTTTNTTSPTSVIQNPSTTPSPSGATSAPMGKSTVTVKEIINSVKTNTNESGTNSLINYRRSDSTPNSLVIKQTQKKIDLTVDSPPSASVSQKTPQSTSVPAPSSSNTNSKQQMGKPLTTTSATTAVTSSQKLTSTKPSASTKPSLNMGILYPNSKNNSNENQPASSKSKSPMNMGIVYPRSQQKTSSSNSEMQIIPTSSPPGTTSISKQLNELSPSISLTAVKNTSTATNKPTSTIAKASTGGGPTNTQINKVLQNNTTIRRTVSPVRPNAPSGGGSQKTPTNNNNNALLARIKANNSNQKKTTLVNSSNPPPLHRTNTTLSTSGSAVNISTKTSAGLTITNVKAPMKTTNMTTKPQTSSVSINQATTLAKQQAAASVAKSSIQRAISTAAAAAAASTSSSSMGNNKTPNDLQKSISSPALPSLTSIKKTIIKRQLSNANNNANNNKLPALTPSPSLTVTSGNKAPAITSSGVKTLSPSMATITRTQNQGNKSNLVAVNKQNLPTMANVTKTLSQMQKRPIQLSASSTATSTSQSGTSSANPRNAVNIRPVDNKQNPTGAGSSVYIIETNINDKKVAIGAPTKSGGGTTVTKVSLQNPNKRKANDAPSKDNTGESKRPKN